MTTWLLTIIVFWPHSGQLNIHEQVYPTVEACMERRADLQELYESNSEMRFVVGCEPI